MQYTIFKMHIMKHGRYLTKQTSQSCKTM